MCLSTPDRQLTGGFFSLAGRSVADIVGVAVPESSGLEPRLDLSAPVPETDDQLDSCAVLVGPLLVAAQWPSPTHRRRQLAMHDPLATTGFTLTEDTRNDARSVSVTFDGPPAS